MGTAFIDSNYLYNLLQQSENVTFPKIADPEYLLLVDCRSRKEYNESHIISAKLAKKNDDDSFNIPNEWHIEFKQYTIVYDGNTSVYNDDSAALRCARHLWKIGARNQVLVVRGGYELFSRFYPFLRTQKILWTPMEIENLLTYPYEIVQSSIFQGTKSQAERPEVKKNCKIGAVINCTDSINPLFDENEQLHLNSLKDELEDDFISVLKSAVDFIQNYVTKRRRILIYSDAGVNRSVVISVAYLMSVNNQPLDKCYEIVRRANFSARPTRSAIEQLSIWEEKIFQEKQTDISDTNPIY